MLMKPIEKPQCKYFDLFSHLPSACSPQYKEAYSRIGIVEGADVSVGKRFRADPEFGYVKRTSAMVAWEL